METAGFGLLQKALQMSVSSLEETREAETKGADLPYTCTYVGHGPSCNILKLQVGHKTSYVKVENGPEFFLVKDKYIFFFTITYQKEMGI